MQGAFEVRGQVVSGVHLEEPWRLIARLLKELASRARLGGLAVLRGPSREGERDAPEPVPILASQDDLFRFVTARTAAEIPKCIRIQFFRAPLGSSTSSSVI